MKTFLVIAKQHCCEGFDYIINCGTDAKVVEAESSAQALESVLKAYGWDEDWLGLAEEMESVVVHEIAGDDAGRSFKDWLAAVKAKRDAVDAANELAEKRRQFEKLKAELGES